jgi:hypothetical protein
MANALPSGQFSSKVYLIYSNGVYAYKGFYYVARASPSVATCILPIICIDMWLDSKCPPKWAILLEGVFDLFKCCRCLQGLLLCGKSVTKFGHMHFANHMHRYVIRWQMRAELGNSHGEYIWSTQVLSMLSWAFTMWQERHQVWWQPFCQSYVQICDWMANALWIGRFSRSV